MAPNSIGPASPGRLGQVKEVGYLSGHNLFHPLVFMNSGTIIL